MKKVCQVVILGFPINKMVIFSEAIMKKIEESGFKISMSKETQLSKEMAEQLYRSNRDSEYFDELTSMMSKYGNTTGVHVVYCKHQHKDLLQKFCHSLFLLSLS